MSSDTLSSLSLSDNISIIDILKNKRLYNDPNVWYQKRKSMDYDKFYDELFIKAREDYNDYIQNPNRLYYGEPVNIALLYRIRDVNDINFYQEIINYICKKLNISDKSIDGVSISEYVGGPEVLEYIYFGTSPSLFDVIRETPSKDTMLQSPDITIDNDKFYNYYFMWRRYNDPNIVRAPSNLQITRENFRTYNLTHFSGWSTKQVRTFYKTNVLPTILQLAGISINTELPAYQEIIKDHMKNKRRMGSLINDYFNNDIKIDPAYISKIDSQIEKLIELNNSRIRSILERLVPTEEQYLYYFITKLKITQALVKKSLGSKITAIKERVEREHLAQKYTYHWQRMCAKLTSLDIEDLRELAEIEGIQNYHMKTKRELCKEFYELTKQKVDEQRRLKIRFTGENPQDPNNIHNNLTDEEKQHKQRYPQMYSTKCYNEDSVLSSDDVRDIKPEFLFTYEHNGKIWCDDIRALYEYVVKRKVTKHPFDRTELSSKLVKIIKRTYENLKNTMISVEEKEQEQPMSKASQLSAKATTFVNLLIHPNDINYFKDSDETLFNEFVMYLEDEQIVSEREVSQIFSFDDLVDQKIALVDLLTLKIRNDPYVVDGISSMSSNITDVYNSVFAGTELSD